MPERLSEWLYPELADRSPRERRQLFAKARDGSFDLVGRRALID